MDTERKHRSPGTASKAVLLIAASTLLAGCVTPLPMEKTAPDLSYKGTRPIAIAVIDERSVLAEGKPPTYVGRAHGSFGIPFDLQVYPALTADKTKKDQTLAQVLQERIAVGLNDEGWQLTPVALSKAPSQEEVASLLASNGSDRLIVLSLKTWFFSLNFSWVTAFNFDWAYNLRILDAQGASLTEVTDSGRDVVDAKANDSWGNQVNLAYRERLIKIFERPEVKAALQQ
jgi:hypothetical protein